MPPYSYRKQVRIIIACMAIHNFIIEQRQLDKLLEESNVVEEMLVGNEEVALIDDEPTFLELFHMGAFRDSIRDEIGLARVFSL